jgi:hypothetical protein
VTPTDTARLAQIKERAEKATDGPWHALADGNQYVNAAYLPTAECVPCARIEEILRPWNPHALIAFGFKPQEYETARFLERDADFIAASREDVPWLLTQLEAALGRERELVKLATMGHRDIEDERCPMVNAPSVWMTYNDDLSNRRCTCGADAHNAKVEEVRRG